MIRRETLTSRVFDSLFAQIKSGKVKSGDKLPTEKQLTKTLGVSRTCVREAMKSLQALQLVSVRAGVGAVVNQPSPGAWFNAHLFAAAIHSEERDAQTEFRKILEVGLVSLAAEKADHLDILALSKSIADFEAALLKRKNRYPYQADVDFHTAVAAASKNPIAEMIWRAFVPPLTEQLRQPPSCPRALPRASAITSASSAPSPSTTLKKLAAPCALTLKMPREISSSQGAGLPSGQSPGTQNPKRQKKPTKPSNNRWPKPPIV